MEIFPFYFCFVKVYLLYAAIFSLLIFIWSKKKNIYNLKRKSKKSKSSWLVIVIIYAGHIKYYKNTMLNCNTKQIHRNRKTQSERADGLSTAHQNLLFLPQTAELKPHSSPVRILTNSFLTPVVFISYSQSNKMILKWLLSDLFCTTYGTCVQMIRGPDLGGSLFYHVLIRMQMVGYHWNTIRFRLSQNYLVLTCFV